MANVIDHSHNQVLESLIHKYYGASGVALTLGDSIQVFHM